ncbi:hypothetical protein V6N11_064746 [Hibiscus sabdariffa]|uniref:Uncharacterized protein n=1 Tax=Hibiscus sabdariffa TaxID=183260 RepID=A0ABR2SHY7_9ROSI
MPASSSFDQFLDKDDGSNTLQSSLLFPSHMLSRLSIESTPFETILGTTVSAKEASIKYSSNQEISPGIGTSANFSFLLAKTIASLLSPASTLVAQQQSHYCPTTSSEATTRTGNKSSPKHNSILSSICENESVSTKKRVLSNDTGTKVSLLTDTRSPHRAAIR